MKRYLKKWVENLLLIIEFIIIILLSADCDSLSYFTFSKLILIMFGYILSLNKVGKVVFIRTSLLCLNKDICGV